MVTIAALPRWMPPAAAGLLLIGCGDQPKSPPISDQGGEPVECALDGAAEFAPVCTLTQISSVSGPVWVVQHPDGGFRRFVLADTASGFASADGSARARSETMEGQSVTAVENDRYRWPDRDDD
ncbi:hypothetical protein [Qipengyuania zhejiangensis]|uniref:hypothetical protein n=1 Tax=Qipengyuania zhejiangensis TaxID=3077782 RepID=UPI002D78C93D|nr:hypothetical protein [Qipengyuania sp. Z2]